MVDWSVSRQHMIQVLTVVWIVGDLSSPYVAVWDHTSHVRCPDLFGMGKVSGMMKVVVRKEG